MKSIFYLLIIYIFILPVAKGQSYLPGELNGQVVFESAPSPGIIIITATGFAKKKGESIINASAGAIYTLLFRGIAASPNSLPMVPDESEKKDDPVVTSLMNGGYTAYIMQSVLISEVPKKRRQDGAKGKQTISRITINADALRRHLEQNGVIRKFGI